MSTITAQNSASKKRSYRLGKRAEQQAETRRKIVEAAVDLHCSLGPARTTVAQIAERAGVQRHTYYAHFPEERGLFLACSKLALDRDPLPDPAGWSDLAPGQKRLSKGLEDLYGWYARNTGQASCILRDAEIHPLTREMVELRMKPLFERIAGSLAEGLAERQRALLGVALDFACYRILSADHAPEAAARLMADAIAGLR